jgi:hypothetical protein
MGIAPGYRGPKHFHQFPRRTARRFLAHATWPSYGVQSSGVQSLEVGKALGAEGRATFPRRRGSGLVVVARQSRG